MLIAQAPLRVSLFGGGSDLPSYLAHRDGAVLSMAINKRVYIVGHPFVHRQGIALRYSRSEDVPSPDSLEHPIARIVLERYGINDIDIAVMSDVPAGTGLGSSSSFTVAFLAFVRSLRGIHSTPGDLAREACEIEIDVLGEPVGYQDQWASAVGGLNVLRFSHGGVEVEPVPIGDQTLRRLTERLHLIPVGEPRRAGGVLQLQSQATQSDPGAIELTTQMVELVDQGVQALTGDLDAIGPLLAEAWSLKRQVAPGITNSAVEDLYERGLSAGASGGKLLGAGSSGYLAFFVPETHQPAFRLQFPNSLPIEVSAEGAGVLFNS